MIESIHSIYYLRVLIKIAQQSQSQTNKRMCDVNNPKKREKGKWWQHRNLLWFYQPLFWMDIHKRIFYVCVDVRWFQLYLDRLIIFSLCVFLCVWRIKWEKTFFLLFFLPLNCIYLFGVLGSKKTKTNCSLQCTGITVVQWKRCTQNMLAKWRENRTYNDVIAPFRFCTKRWNISLWFFFASFS